VCIGGSRVRVREPEANTLVPQGVLKHALATALSALQSRLLTLRGTSALLY